MGTKRKPLIVAQREGRVRVAHHPSRSTPRWMVLRCLSVFSFLQQPVKRRSRLNPVGHQFSNPAVSLLALYCCSFSGSDGVNDAQCALQMQKKGGDREREYIHSVRPLDRKKNASDVTDNQETQISPPGTRRLARRRPKITQCTKGEGEGGTNRRHGRNRRKKTSNKSGRKGKEGMRTQRPRSRDGALPTRRCGPNLSRLSPPFLS